MINKKGRPVMHNGVEVPVSKTIVTKTHYLDLLALYKRFRKDFDEGKCGSGVFFCFQQTI